MNRITSKNIRQILIPAMEEHGFTHAFYPDCCVFVKRNEEGGKLERITVTQFEYYKCIKIEIDILPTYLHLPFIDEKNVIIENRKVKKSSLEGWIYKTEEDIKQILEMIKESLEKKGFEYLDTILNDPEDLYPIYSEYKDMYENHDKYLNEFNFVAKGGRWTWNEDSKKSMIAYPHKDLSVDAIIIPASEIYGGIQGNRKHSICEAIAKELKYIR